MANDGGAFVERTYRRCFGGNLTFYRVQAQQSDLYIGTHGQFPEKARAALLHARAQLEAHIRTRPSFLTSFAPLAQPADAPPLIRSMYQAAECAGVGPMAAVAGAVACAVGRTLLAYSDEVIVENGGDIYINSKTPRHVALYAGQSALSMQVAAVVPAGEWGVCTSSGRVGPSISLGKADAAMVISHDAALADAAATALGNRLQTAQDMPAALQAVYDIGQIYGAAAVIDDRLAACGMLEFIPVQSVAQLQRM